MSEDSADKTEKPTPKKLREAHKKGDVAKSKDLSSTAGTLVWLLVFAATTQLYYEQLAELFGRSFVAMHQPFEAAATALAMDAVRVMFVLGVVPTLIVSVMGVLVEFLQVRGVFTFEKIKPDLKHLNPFEGVKRIFKSDNLIELVKSILKATVIVSMFVVLVRHHANDLAHLSYAPPAAVGALWWRISSVLVVWVLVFFLFFSLGDALLQHFNFIKKMRMSRRDIRDEMKDDEGDPYIKQKRKQLHHEWSQQNMKAGVRRANVVVTNPTHYAVALYYEKGETVVPIVTAKGEDHMAQLIRETAAEEGIPMMRNVDLARALYAEVEMDDYVPQELFEAVAQVLLWARAVREGTVTPEDLPVNDVPTAARVLPPPSRSPL
jgi:type III secretion protein U